MGNALSTKQYQPIKWNFVLVHWAKSEKNYTVKTVSKKKLQGTSEPSIKIKIKRLPFMWEYIKEDSINEFYEYISLVNEKHLHRLPHFFLNF